MNPDYITPIKELESKLHDLKDEKSIESNVMRKKYFAEIKSIEQKYIHRWNIKNKIGSLVQTSTSLKNKKTTRQRQ